MKKVKNIQSYMRKVQKCMKRNDIDSFSKEIDLAFERMEKDIKLDTKIRL